LITLIQICIQCWVWYWQCQSHRNYYQGASQSVLHPLYTDKVFSNFLLPTKAFWPEETVTQPQYEVTGTKAP